MSHFHLGSTIRELRSMNGWFDKPGAYAILDGQFGSTGKGALASLFAHTWGDKINLITSNAGPNSGHTGYTQEGEKIVTKQLPVSAVVIQRQGRNPAVHLNAGAVICPKTLGDEIEQYRFNTNDLKVHPNAAVIRAMDLENDHFNTTTIASTGKGVGPALINKMLRHPNNTYGAAPYHGRADYSWSQDVVFVETSQGYSLSINSEFYPYVTSRECTIQQALADARIPPKRLRKLVLVVRTFPIRVGNTALGTSGGCYPDQKELTWEQVEQAPEFTTVTNRQRRVFTWSWRQFYDAVKDNEPDAIFLSFCDYGVWDPVSKRPIKEDYAVAGFANSLRDTFFNAIGRYPEFVLLGYGPRPDDVLMLRK
jgi:adenylosuccinate synthase